MADAPHLALVVLAVEDLARAKAFYTAVFGWPVQVDVPVYVELAMPNGLRLGLYVREGYARNTGALPAPIPPGGLGPAELYLYASDLPAALARAEAVGARCLSPLTLRDWGDRAAYFADPDGHVFVLAEPA